MAFKKASRRRAMPMRMFRRKHHKAKMTIPLAVVLGFVPGVSDTLRSYGKWRQVSGNTGDDMISVFLGDFTGVQTSGAAVKYGSMFMGGNTQTTWSSWRLKYGLYPALGGIFAHVIANKTGLNRMIGQSFRKIPILSMIRI